MRFVVRAQAAPEDVFDRVADFARLADWDPFVRHVEVDGGQLAVGTSYVLHSLAGMALRYRVVQLDRPRCVVYTGGGRRWQGTDTITLSGSATTVEINVTSELAFSGWVQVVGPVIRSLVWLGARLVSIPAMRRHLARVEPAA